MRRDILDRLLAARAGRRPAVLITDLTTGSQALFADGGIAAGDLPVADGLRAAALAAGETGLGRSVDADGRSLFIQPFNPPLRLIVIGAVHIAQALAPMAALAGYDVTVIDPRRAFASDLRFPAIALRTDWPDEALAALAPDRRTALVTLTHDPKLDDPALEAALRSDCFYVAALGSRKTHAARLDRLRALGHGEAALARINGPAGLPIGALTPAEIAVSILAQMTETLRRRAPSP